MMWWKIPVSRFGISTYNYQRLRSQFFSYVTVLLLINVVKAVQLLEKFPPSAEKKLILFRHLGFAPGTLFPFSLWCRILRQTSTMNAKKRGIFLCWV
jgi:hypothetical protein